jgi:hypothetical protein
VILEPNRQGVPQSPMLFLPSRGKPYLRGEGCPLIYRRSPTRPLCGLSYRSEHLTSTPSYVQPIRDPTPRVGACREGCFHADTPLHIHMITRHHPLPKHHPSQRPGIPLFQRSVLPSHPRTTPRPPTIVYPHRASSTTPLASASTPPHEPYLFLAADPISVGLLPPL